MSSNRLPQPWGSRIDRSATLSFEFEGKRVSAFKGDTIASAVLAEGQKVLSRSFKYHRPRGVLTMAGDDANTLVQLEAEPNVRADIRAAENGMVVTAQNVIGSLSRDRGALLERFGSFLPVGFYYRSFFKPGSKAWLKVWEPIIRKSAGLGKVSFNPPAADYRKRSLHADLVVVGAGPAGLAAALEAADAGVGVLIIDRDPELGGALNYARFDIEGETAKSTLGELAERARGHGNITLLLGATCNGWYGDNYLPVLQGDTLFKVRAKELILATGSQEQPLVFRNNDLPGIMFSSAAQRLMRLYAVRPGKTAVVFAGGLDGYRVALDLHDAGIKVAALVEPASEAPDAGYLAALGERKIDVVKGARIVEAHGATAVEAVSLRLSSGEIRRVGCDLVVTAAGYTPGYQLALHAGAKLGYNDATGHFTLSNIPPHMHLAGSVEGHFDLRAVLHSGAAAGVAAARTLGIDIPAEPDLPPQPNIYANYQGDVQPHPKGRDFIDFDEDLQAKDIWNAVEDGYRELELVKRFSTVGMGPSQGRHSALNTARIVAAATDRAVADVGITTSRPPFGPEKLGLLAGPVHHTYRLTALHEELVAAGVKMMPVGAWWRPAYFGTPDNAAAAIEAEVKAVREGVAVLDVSTLGKIALRGPDAGKFLDRFYTMLHSNQPVGRVRYCLALNEMGSVIDDGVAYRVSDDHFHVSTTTGMAARIFADMSWWNAQWQLDVDIQNVTGAFAGLNVSGPLARKALEALEGEIDFSSDAFGFLDGRAGTLAGTPVLAMRIGFTGELSYELHVPYSKARGLWQALMKAGRQYGIRPYGLEASRILRLEKGHIIIGQDTDAMTTPDELSMGWALSKKKDFYLGRTANAKRRERPMNRKLCGFQLDQKSISNLGEGALVFNGGHPVGFVSSVLYSPTLGKTIGLAYADPQDAEPGGKIEIRCFDGRNIVAPVVSPHFYDPENKRQNL
jgi:sarcosine oxidase, subunit alpha